MSSALGQTAASEPRLTSSGFFLGGKRKKGLTKLLRERWGVVQKRSSGKFKSVKRTCDMSGKEHGTLVHGQLELLVAQLRAGVERDRPPQIPEVPNLDKCTCRILRRLKLSKIVPLFAEVRVATARAATAVDLLSFDCEKREWCVVEVKTEYENEDYDESRGNMRGELSRLPDSHRVRHWLQAEASRLMLAKRLVNPAPSSAYVLRALPKRRGTEFFGVPKFPELETLLS